MHFGNTCRFKAGACPVILIIKIVEKKKNVFGDIKSMLTRDQMKQVKGGSGGSGGCCAHNADWTQSQCGYPDAGQAQNAASSAAQQSGNHYYWCCQSC